MNDSQLQVTNIYEYPDGCREISGFGGGYEADCRTMVIAGVSWLQKNVAEKPMFKVFENVYGFISGENDSAREILRVMNEAIGGTATGAMMQACASHVAFAYMHGWDAYILRMQDDE